jgi:(S)-mandelate dehydrogenase
MPSHLEINRARRLRGNGLASARTILDLRARARRKLPNFMYEYLEGGADEETTLRRNTRAFEHWLWSPRLSIDPGRVETEVTLFGTRLALPLVIAPTGFNGMLWRDGDLALARSAAAAGIAMAQSTVSMNTIEEVCAVPGLNHWFQLYGYGGLQVIEKLIDRAERAGSQVLVVTIDGAVPGNRLWDQRNYVTPGRLNLRSKFEALRHPHWLSSVVLKSGPPNFVNLKEFAGGPDASVFTVGQWIAANRPKIVWSDIEVLRSRWKRTLVIKGILRADEAERARDIGADGIVLSNHGGRQAEPAVTPLEVLPEIRERLGPDYPILIDSGVRTGGHIAVALALGASAVLTGRATLYGLAAGGEAGVTKAIDILKAELIRTLALAGVASVGNLCRDALRSSRAET